MEYITKNNIKIKLEIADITTLDVDAIVNAANEGLYEGGGVCGAIFDAAGNRELQKECNTLSPINTGEAVITKGYKLKARYIIHAVGPRYKDYKKNKCEEQLKNAYLNSLKVADKNNLETIAFPSISTGIYNYPIEDASFTAIEVFLDYVPKTIKEITMCFLKQSTLEPYENALKELTK